MLKNSTTVEDLVHDGDSNQSIFDKLQFDHEIESLFIPMGADEFRRLGDSIERVGVTSPVIVSPQAIVIDGHNRIRKCRELKAQGRLKTYPDFKIVRLPNKTAEKIYAIETNLNSRTKSDYLKIESAKVLIDLEEEAAAERMRAGKKALASNDARVGRTAEQVAKRIGGVSASTRRARNLPHASRR